MFIACPNCGKDVYYKTNLRCMKCGAIVRRCVDCVHFDPFESLCAERGGNIDPEQALQPTRLSVSAGCQAYEPAALVPA